MKYSFALLAILGLAAAQLQGLDQFPSCGLSCLTSNIPESGCSVTDFKCSCSNEKFITKASSCIQTSCQPDDQKKALAAAKTLCASQGVDISPPSDTTSTKTTAKPTTEPTTAESSAKPTEEPSSTFVPSASIPAVSSNGSYTPPVETQTPGNAAGRTSAALGLVGLGMLAAIAL